jgi:uncharacterized protein with von Willebrand factor type A (vWA) domain
MFVSTKWSVNAKSLRVENTFQSIGITNMPKGAILNLASIAVTAKRHFRQVVLMKKLTRSSLHAKITKPMATHHRSQPRIVLGRCQDWFGLVTSGKDGSSLTVW